MPVSKVSPHPRRCTLPGITAHRSTRGREATAPGGGAKGVFHPKKAKAAAALRTSFLLDVMCSRGMPPPSERQKAAGYQNEG